MGGLRDVLAYDLAALVLNAALERAGVEPDLVDDVILWQSYQNGENVNIARMALLKAGWPEAIPGVTFDRRCCTGLDTVCFAASLIRSEQARVVVAGGVESMSNAEFYLPGHVKWGIGGRKGMPRGHGDLAMACHFRIMVDTPKAKVGLTELNLGIIPGWGGSQRLPRLVGRAKALDMILFSKTVSAGEALEIGLVSQVSSPENLMDDTFAFAEKLAERPPIAVGCVLKAMSAGEYEGLEKGLLVETEGTVRVRESKDCLEGFKAFLEKRKPVFSGE
jgi:hypothetical protein